LEPKFASLAVHYRLVADAAVVRVEAAVDRAVASHPGLRKSLGKKVFEIQPDIDWDKGRALLWLIDSLGIAAEDGIIIYIGDDLTDEDAFRALPQQGVGIVVRDGETRPTAAQYRLADPDEVRAFLARLADLRSGSS
jgi:trehalose-phosphatase